MLTNADVLGPMGTAEDVSITQQVVSSPSSVRDYYQGTKMPSKIRYGAVPCLCCYVAPLASQSRTGILTMTVIPTALCPGEIAGPLPESNAWLEEHTEHAESIGRVHEVHEILGFFMGFRKDAHAASYRSGVLLRGGTNLHQGERK